MLASSWSGGERLVCFVSSGGVRCGVSCVRVLGVYPRGLCQCLSRTHGTRSRGGARVLVHRVSGFVLKVLRVFLVFKSSALNLSSRSLTPFLFCFGDHAEVDVRSPRTADGSSGATAEVNADIDTCRSDDARLLSGWASDRIAYRTAGCHGLRTVYFSCGTLFRLVRHVASGTLFRLPPTPECRRRPYVGLETSLRAPPLCGPSPFFWVPWCFRVCFGRLLLLRWRPQCVAGAPAWSLVLALALTFVMASTVFHCRSDALQDSQVEEHGHFSLGRTRSSLAVLREVTSLLQRQERQMTPRCVSAGGVPIKTCTVARKR